MRAFIDHARSRRKAVIPFLRAFSFFITDSQNLAAFRCPHKTVHFASGSSAVFDRRGPFVKACAMNAMRGNNFVIDQAVSKHMP
jgi:hypothetical protein